MKSEVLAQHQAHEDPKKQRGPVDIHRSLQVLAQGRGQGSRLVK